MGADTDRPTWNQASAPGLLRGPTMADIHAERVDDLLIVKAFAGARALPTQMTPSCCESLEALRMGR